MEPKKRRSCTWTAVDEFEVNDVFDTQCGEVFQITHGTPSENSMHFCCYCGGRIVERFLHEHRE